MPYDPEEIGNDNPFVKKDGKIVAFFGHSGRTKEQLERSAPGIQAFLVMFHDGEPIRLLGVTPQDALEALRRREPKVAAEVADGTLPMWKPILHRVNV